MKALRNVKQICTVEGQERKQIDDHISVRIKGLVWRCLMEVEAPVDYPASESCGRSIQQSVLTLIHPYTSAYALGFSQVYHLYKVVKEMLSVSVVTLDCLITIIIAGWMRMTGNFISEYNRLSIEV